MATPAPAAAAPRAAVSDTYQRILDTIAPNASQLKRNYNSYLARGLAVAAGIHMLGIGAYWGYSAYQKAQMEALMEDTTEPIAVNYQDITPPSITDPPAEAASAAAPAAAVPSGTPTPVPDAEAPPDQTIARQEELSTAGTGPPGSTGTATGVTGGTGTAVYTPPAAPPPPAPPPPAPPPPAPPPEPEPPAIFDMAEVQPELIGGLPALQSSITYPDFERRAGVQGRVIVAFVVDENGRPTNVSVARGVSPGLDRAAVQAVQNARFNPGQQNGRPVKVRFTLPISFTLR